MIFNLLIILPVALLMCIGPLFSPFIALPMAQKRQWTNGCKSALFAGDAILEGLSFTNEKAPRISLILKSGVNISYTMHGPGDGSNIWMLTVDNHDPAHVEPDILPFVREISYDVKQKTLDATCETPQGNSTTTTKCMDGNFSPEKFLFTLHPHVYSNDSGTDSDRNRDMILKPLAKETTWYSDAPSYDLRLNGSEDQPPVLQTVVTKPNSCESLKVCIGKAALEASFFNIIAPLAITLYYQDQYATYCKTERLRL